jgi:hypothetical protein
MMQWRPTLQLPHAPSAGWAVPVIARRSARRHDRGRVPRNGTGSRAAPAARRGCMSEKDSAWPGHAPAPLERLDGKPPVVPSVDGGWLLELTRGPSGRFEISDERVGGIVRVEGQAVLRHPAGHVVQPVTVAMRDEGTGELGRASWESLGRRGRRTGLPWIRAKRRQRTRPRGHMRAHAIYPARDKLSRAR